MGRNDVQGHIAIITGGASGIGRALGAELVQRGARVILTDVDGDAAVRAAAEIASAGATGVVVGRSLDVVDEGAFRSLVDDVVQEHGRLDLLVNNAGISLGGPTHELTAAHWDRIIDVNLRGVINGVLAAYPRMIDQGYGHIVNTSSGAGLVGPPFVAAYATTKHAVVGLSLALRPEAALHGVDVSVLCPGSVDTAILDRPPPTDLPATATGVVTGREYLAVVAQKPIPTDRFARLAIRGILRRRALIVVPAQARSLWYVQRVSPRLTQRMLRVVARRVERKLLAPRAPKA